MQELLEEEVPQWEMMRDRVHAAYKSFSSICDAVYLEALQDRVSGVLRRWNCVIERAKSTRAAVEVKLYYKCVQILPEFALHFIHRKYFLLMSEVINPLE